VIELEGPRWRAALVGGGGKGVASGELGDKNNRSERAPSSRKWGWGKEGDVLGKRDQNYHHLKKRKCAEQTYSGVEAMWEKKDRRGQHERGAQRQSDRWTVKKRKE